MTPVVEEFQLFASHHQFYVQDSDPPVLAMGDPSFWTAESMENHLGTAEGIVGISTGSYDVVKVRVEQRLEEPPLELSAWDHVVETGLQVRSRMLLIYGCTATSGVFFFVEPGHYRVRCCQSNLALSSDCTGQAGDGYVVQFWPSTLAGTRLLKKWAGAWPP